MNQKKNKDVHNFSAGPCILSEEVMQKAAEAVIEYNNTGLSILEMSHRSPEFVEIMETARSLVKDLLNVPSHYEVLFLQGGASLQFTMVAMNLLIKKGGYIDTGVWSKKAIKEVQKMGGEVNVIASSADRNYSYYPYGYKILKGLDYVHFTSNNTIYGTQINYFPKLFSIPLVCDMSSDIFSREINVADFGLIYAGVQKNLGPAGATLVIINPEILGHTNRSIPSMLDYQIHIDKQSMYNTPPCFSVYVSMLTLQWLKKLGGVKAIEKINNEKAKLLYDEIDRNSLFKSTLIGTKDRSKMNVTFILYDESLTSSFLALAKERKLDGIKGHRDVGGFRASIYNAMPIESVEALVQAMKFFEEQNS